MRGFTSRGRARRRGEWRAVAVGDVTLLVSVANPLAEGVFQEGDRVTVRMPAPPIPVVPPE